MTLSKQIFKYIVAGGTAAVVDLSLLYLLTEFWGIWYLLSTILAFMGAFAVSFTLQKFWTFRDHAMDGIHKQLTMYFVVTAINLGLNTLFVYLLVEHGDLWYMLAQVIAGVTIAFESFLVYKFIIFKRGHGVVISPISEFTKQEISE